MFDTPRASRHASPQVQERTAALNFSTPIPHDPDLPHRLRRAHRELGLTLDVLATVVERGAAAAVVEAARSCLDQMHALHRLEAVRLYPRIASRRDLPAADAMAFTQARHEASGLGRRFMRIMESALAPGAEGAIGASDVHLAATLLQRYKQLKEERLYQLYRGAGSH